jgi:hypothetical protein
MLDTQEYTLFDLSEALPVHVLTKKEIIKRNVDLLLHRLSQVEPGGVITYSELAETCPDANNAQYLRTKAKVLAQEEYGIVFAALNGVALRRVPVDDVAVLSSVNARRRIASALNTWEEKLGTVDPSELTTDNSRKQYIDSQMKLYQRQRLEEYGDREASQAIEKAVKNSQGKTEVLSGKQLRALLIEAQKELMYMG